MAFWVISDCGFGEINYKCSVCDKNYSDIFDFNKERCSNCGNRIDDDKNVYWNMKSERR